MGQDSVERRGLSLLLRTVLGVRFHVVAAQLMRRKHHVLASRDRAPAAHGVNAKRDRILREEVDVTFRNHRFPGEIRIRVEQLLLPDLELGQVRALAYEIDPEVVEPLTRAIRQHVLDRQHEVRGLEVPAPETEPGRVELGHLCGIDRRKTGMRGVSAVRPTCLHGLRHCRADLLEQRIVDGQGLVRALEHGHALLAAQQLADPICGERTEHRHVQHADLESPLLAQVIGHDLGVGHERPLADQNPLGIFQPIAGGPLILPARELLELAHRLVRQSFDVVEVERTLRRYALHVAVLVLHGAEQRGVVQVEHLGNPPARVPERQLLGRRGRLDDVGRVAEVLLDQLALRESQRLDHVTGEESVLGHQPRVEGELGDPVRDQVEIGDALHVLGEQLEETGVIDGVVVVVPGVHVQRMLGHRARGDVQDVGQALSDGRVQRLVHVGDALAARKIRRAKPGHAHSGRDGGRCMFALGLEEQERASVDVQLPGGPRRGPSLAHLGRRRDRIRSGGLASGRFHLDHGFAAVHRSLYSRVPDLDRWSIRLLVLALDHYVSLPAITGSSRSSCAPSTHWIAPVGQRVVAASVARSIAS